MYDIPMTKAWGLGQRHALRAAAARGAPGTLRGGLPSPSARPAPFLESPHIWANYNDLTATSLESWLMRGITPKWPYFRLVNYCNLPRYMSIYVFYMSHLWEVKHGKTHVEILNISCELLFFLDLEHDSPYFKSAARLIWNFTWAL